ncbi:UNVERIFIED_CONTAM: hypothetical protein FKN15_073749 [Acipenser sinensis]
MADAGFGCWRSCTNPKGVCGVELGRKTCSHDESGEVGRDPVSGNDAFGAIIGSLEGDAGGVLGDSLACQTYCWDGCIIADAWKMVSLDDEIMGN